MLRLSWHGVKACAELSGERQQFPIPATPKWQIIDKMYLAEFRS